MPHPLLRHIPSVNELLENPQLKALRDRLSHTVVVSRARAIVEDLRREVQSAASEIRIPSPTEIAERIARRILLAEEPVLRPVINATGVLLHTGLGRAPLAEEAIAEMTAVARDYANVELDLGSGERSQRALAVEGLLKELTGAEAAVVVNNNAAATVLALTAIAQGREVIVSRGELIEIGGSFRLPDVMSASGATLCEVGSTNKTRIDDYRRALNERTAALLQVHTSNYVVVGFTEAVPLGDLVRLGREKGLPVIHDIGSGALIDFGEFGLSGEPVARKSIEAGADLVLFSGDKLLGGPQCGILVGRRDLIQRIAKHPLMRAVRCDKLTFAALAATLRLYRSAEGARQSVPILAFLSTSVENLRQRAQRLAPQFAACRGIASAEVIDDTTFLGGGSIPTQRIPTVCVALKATEHSIDKLSQALRQGAVSVVGRIQNDRLLLDLRTVFPRQDQDLVTALTALQPDPSPPQAAPSEPPVEPS